MPENSNITSDRKCFANKFLRKILIIMPKINTFIVGAMKAGTTYVADVLEQHQDICISRPKESMFFIDTPELTTRGMGVRVLEKAYAHFAGERVVCEASTHNLSCAESAKYIKDYNQDARIICILRNPVDRALSHYKHLKRAGLIKDDINSFFDSDCLLRRECLNGSLYNLHLSRYFELFGRNAVKVYYYEDLVKNRPVFFERLLDDLGVGFPVQGLDLDFRSNESAGVNLAILQSLVFRNRSFLRLAKSLVPTLIYTRAKSAWQYLESFNTKKDDAVVYSRTRDVLEDLLRSDIRKLEETLERDFSGWLSRGGAW